MNIFSQLEHMTNLTDNEKLVVQYLRNNPEKFVSMSASDIAKACYVSTSTVYRLCRKLDLSGFSELKVQVSASLHEFLQTKEHFDFNYPVKQNQTQYQIIHQLKEVYDQTVISSVNLIDIDQLRLIVHHMKKSQAIDIYTSAGSLFFAQNFQFQIQEIGIDVFVPTEEYQQRLRASCSNANHFAILISFGGRNLLIKKLIHILKKTKTPILIICGAQQNPYEKYADYCLYMSPYENHYNKISSFSTRLTLLFILDCIYTCYFELDYDENVKKKLNYYEQLRKAG